MQRLHDQKLEIPLIDYSKGKLWSMTSEVDYSKIHIWPNPSLHSFNLENYSKKESPLYRDYSLAVWIGDKIVVDGIYIGKDGKQYTVDGERYFTSAEKGQAIIENEINNSGGIYLTENLEKLKANEMVTAGKHPSAVGVVNKYFDNTLGKDIGHQVLTNPEFRNADGNLKSRPEINKIIDDKFYHGHFGARGLPTFEGMRDAVKVAKQTPLITTPNFSRDNPVETIKWTLDNPKPPNTNTRTNIIAVDYGFTAGADYSITYAYDDYGNVWLGVSGGMGVSAIPIKMGNLSSGITMNISTGTTINKHNHANEVRVEISGDPSKFFSGFSRYGGFDFGPGIKVEKDFSTFPNPLDIKPNIVWNTLNLPPNAALRGGVSKMIWTGKNDEGLRNAVRLGKQMSLGIVDVSVESLKETFNNFHYLQGDNVEHIKSLF